MGSNFTKRKLKTVRDLSIKVMGAAAIVEFEWDFTATRVNGEGLNSKGWESQVYVRMDRAGWKLVHALLRMIDFQSAPSDCRISHAIIIS